MKHVLTFLLIAFCLITCNVAVFAADTNTVTSSGTVTIDKTPPTASAPSIVINTMTYAKVHTVLAFKHKS